MASLLTIVSAFTKGNGDYFTSITCDGELAYWRCYATKKMNIIRANYGRTVSICVKFLYLHI